MGPRSKRSLDSALSGPSKRRSHRQKAALATQEKSKDKIDNTTFFKAVWRELRSDGWHHKPPPRSASDSFYRYVRPGASLKGREGVDYFVGDQELLSFYLREIASPPVEENISTSAVASVPEHDRDVSSNRSRGLGPAISTSLQSKVVSLRSKRGANGGLEPAQQGYSTVSNQNTQFEAPSGLQTQIGQSELNQGHDAVTISHQASGGETQQQRFQQSAEDNGGRAVDDGQMNSAQSIPYQNYTAASPEVPLNEYHRLPALGGVVIPIRESAVVHDQATPRRALECTNGSRRVFTEETRNPPNGITITTTGAGTSHPDGVMPLLSPNAPRVSRGPAVFVPSLYVNILVAFSPSRESWMKAKVYKKVGTAYIVGRICTTVKSKQQGDKKRQSKSTSNQRTPLLFQVRWIDSQFQSEPENISLYLVQKGHANYNLLMAGPDTLYWQTLCEAGDDAIAIDDSIDELQKAPVPYYSEQSLPTSLAEAEAIKSMRFDPVASMEKPEMLFQHADGSNDTKLRDEFRYIFEHSASASFLAYLPLYVWQQVVHEMNAYAQVNQLSIGEPFVLQEIMTFLGILFYMEITVKGEYANYWGRQAEEDMFGVPSLDLENVMPLKWFKLLRQSLSFRSDVSVENIQRDPAARIRTLLNVLKVTGGKYVDWAAMWRLMKQVLLADLHTAGI